MLAAKHGDRTWSLENRALVCFLFAQDTADTVLRWMVYRNREICFWVEKNCAASVTDECSLLPTLALSGAWYGRQE